MGTFTVWTNTVINNNMRLNDNKILNFGWKLSLIFMLSPNFHPSCPVLRSTSPSLQHHVYVLFTYRKNMHIGILNSAHTNHQSSADLHWLVWKCRVSWQCWGHCCWGTRAGGWCFACSRGRWCWSHVAHCWGSGLWPWWWYEGRWQRLRWMDL